MNNFGSAPLIPDPEAWNKLRDQCVGSGTYNPTQYLRPADVRPAQCTASGADLSKENLEDFKWPPPNAAVGDIDCSGTAGSPIWAKPTLQFMPGDIILTKGNNWLAKSIRFFTRSFGESRTKVNHVGLIVKGADFIGDCKIVEALTTVKRWTIAESYGGTTQEVAVYRPINLTQDEINKVVTKANSYVGKTYGYLKIVAHLLDWCLLGSYVFRRLVQLDDYPICSWVVACAYSYIGKDFGVTAETATPDDIWDFVIANGDKYVCVRSLKRV